MRYKISENQPCLYALQSPFVGGGALDAPMRQHLTISHRFRRIRTANPTSVTAGARIAPLLLRRKDDVTFLSPNKKVTKEVGLRGAGAALPRVKCALLRISRGALGYFRSSLTYILIPEKMFRFSPEWWVLRKVPEWMFTGASENEGPEDLGKFLTPNS